MDTKALRQKILDLAIRGKLVPQDPNDEPASVLLERIRAEKQLLVKDGKLKAKDIKNDTIIYKGEDNLHYEKFPDGSVKCIEDEIPFELPNGWEWCRLKHICMMAAGKSKPTEQIKAEPFEGCCTCFGGNGIRGYVDEYNHEGTFSIVGRQGALCGNINIASGKFYATEHAVVTTLFGGIDFNWSNYILEALQLNKYATGAAQPGLSVANVLNVFVPVAPTQEQQRIGQRIAESIKIIDVIEQEKLDLQTVITCTTSKILDLAIRGKLVPQDPNDEPASVLLERIRAEKEELIRQGKIKRDKKESVIFKGEDNSYYENLPDNWEIATLAQISYFERGITFPASAKELTLNGANIPCVRTANVQDEFEIDDLIYVDRKYMKSNKNKLLQKGDIIMSSANSKELVGKTCIVKELKNEMTFGGFVLVIRGVVVNKKYLHLCLRDLFNKGAFIQESTQTTNIANVNTETLTSMQIPLPSLYEQNRIVDAVEVLFEKLSEIEKSLS